MSTRLRWVVKKGPNRVNMVKECPLASNFCNTWNSQNKKFDFFWTIQTIETIGNVRTVEVARGGLDPLLLPLAQNPCY